MYTAHDSKDAASADEASIAMLSPAQIIADAPPGSAQANTLRRTTTLHERFGEWRFAMSSRFENVDLAPDLAEAIGSRRWFRGIGTMMALSAMALALWPDFGPLEAAPAVAMDDSARDEYLSQMIMPLALGGDTGRRMGATSSVVTLASAPERPRLDLMATLSSGDSFVRMLQRAGVGSGDANRVNELVARSIDPSSIEAGTQVDITLGRRTSPNATRPLDGLKFRARFDLALQIERIDDDLSLKRIPISVDDTPLRIRGTVGSSLYRSARAAGAPASAVQQYLSTLGDHIDLDNSVGSDDVFDIVISHRRAETGERQAGKLIYAGIERGGKAKAQLMRWGSDNRFYEASGVGEQRSGLMAPVPGPVSSNYGMRRHPILGYRRMHSGMDFRASRGTPIVAVTDGRVTGAGRMGGCGNAVRLNHAGNLSTRYCHMSRVAVRSGQSVQRGQIIGYVGSTGLSTGPHLHYEMYRGGRAVNPASVKFVTRAQLTGSDLAAFRDALAKVKRVEAGAALAPLRPANNAADAPTREIDRLQQAKKVS